MSAPAPSALALAEPGQVHVSPPRAADPETDRLLEIGYRVWERLRKDEPSTLTARVGGEARPVSAVPGPVLTALVPDTEQRQRLTEEAAARQERLLWVQGGGSLLVQEQPWGLVRAGDFGLERAYIDGPMYVGWRNSLDYTFQLPLSYRPEEPLPSEDDVRYALAPLTEPPLDARAAAAVPAGARLVLTGRGFVGQGSARRREGRPTAHAEHRASVQVDFLGEGRVRITTHFENASSVRHSVLRQLGRGTFVPSLNTTLQWPELNLDDPEQAAIYERILRLEVDEAGAEARRFREGGELRVGSGVRIKPIDDPNGVVRLGFELDTEKVPEDDPRIAEDSFRRRLTQSARAEGRTLSWFRNGGQLRFRAHGATPFASGFRVGGSGEIEVTYSLLTPVELDPQDGWGDRVRVESKAAARNMAQWLTAGLVDVGALDPERLPNFPPGTVMVVRASDGLSAFGQVGQGGLVSAGPIEVGTASGYKVSYGRRVGNMVVLEWLENGRIGARLIETNDRLTEAAFEARAGFERSGYDLPNTSDTTKDRAEAYLADIGVPEVAAKPLVDEILEFFSLEARVHLQDRRTVQETSTIYEALDRQDPEDVARILDLVHPINLLRGPRDDGLVARMVSTVESDHAASGHEANIVGLRFVRRVDREDMEITADAGTHGRFTGRTVRGRAHRRTFHSMLFNEEKATVNVHRVESRSGDQTVFLEIAFEGRDPRFTRRDAERFEGRARSWGADVPDASAVRGRRRLLGIIPRSAHGRSRYRARMYVSEEGLRKVVAAGPQGAFEAYAQALVAQGGDPPRWAVAQGARRQEAIEIIDRYRRLRALERHLNRDRVRRDVLGELRELVPNLRRRPNYTLYQDAVYALEREMRDRFGRSNLQREAESLEEAHDLAFLVIELNEAELEGGVGHMMETLLDLQTQLLESRVGDGRFFYTAVAALAEMAGDDAHLETLELDTQSELQVNWKDPVQGRALTPHEELGVLIQSVLNEQRSVL